MSVFDCPEHPVIRNMMQTGYPDGKEPEWPTCPVCGEECDTIYYSKKHNKAVGCEMCLVERESWSMWGG